LSLKNERQQIEWRRSKVLELNSQGHSQPEISRILHVSLGTVNKDLSYLRQQAHDNLQRHVQQKLPEEYQRCLTGMNQVLKLSWQIANNNNNSNNGHDLNANNSNTITTGDERTKLQALALINDCYKYIMDLTTNGVVITDAIKFVQTNKEKLMSGKDEENDKASKESDYDEDQLQEDKTGELKEETTTNQVF
jgi:hypothetical protein